MACEELAVPVPGGGGTKGEFVDPGFDPVGGGGTFGDELEPGPVVGGGGTNGGLLGGTVGVVPVPGGTGGT